MSLLASLWYYPPTFPEHFANVVLQAEKDTVFPQLL